MIKQLNHVPACNRSDAVTCISIKLWSPVRKTIHNAVIPNLRGEITSVANRDDQATYPPISIRPPIRYPQ